jgi:hypothetical protein
MPMENKWRIGDTISTMDYFLQTGIPIPTENPFNLYSALLPRGQGGNKSAGYQNATLSWATMGGEGLNSLKSYVDPVRATGAEIFLTLQKMEGETFGDHWIDIRGQPHVITYTKIGAKASGKAYRNVVLFVNNITIVNDPSVV